MVHKPRVSLTFLPVFTGDQNHKLLYTSAAPFQNMQVKCAKDIPLQVLATRKLDKSPVWSEWRAWDKASASGWFYTDDLAAAREYLHTQGHVPRVAVTHKCESSSQCWAGSAW